MFVQRVYSYLDITLGKEGRKEEDQTSFSDAEAKLFCFHLGLTYHTFLLPVHPHIR